MSATTLLRIWSTRSWNCRCTSVSPTSPRTWAFTVSRCPVDPDRACAAPANRARTSWMVRSMAWMVADCRAWKAWVAWMVSCRTRFTDSIRWLISSPVAPERSDSLRTSSATTAKPLPSSRAWAASMAALRARRLVWAAMAATSADIADRSSVKPASSEIFARWPAQASWAEARVPMMAPRSRSPSAMASVMSRALATLPSPVASCRARCMDAKRPARPVTAASVCSRAWLVWAAQRGTMAWVRRSVGAGPAASGRGSAGAATALAGAGARAERARVAAAKARPQSRPETDMPAATQGPARANPASARALGVIHENLGNAGIIPSRGRGTALTWERNQES